MYNHQSKLIINIGLFAIFLLWNSYQPLVADDFGRSFADVLKNGTLLAALYNDYYTWTGRFSAEILAFVFLSKSYASYLVPLMNIINSFVLVAVLNLLYKLINLQRNSTKSFVVFSLLYLIYFILIGTFAQDFLWKTVALQYAWGALVLLIIIWRFYKNILLGQTSLWWALILYALSGVFIGFYNEIYIAFIVDLYLTVLIVWLIFRLPLSNLIKSQHIVFILALLIAGIISIKAPGNFIRRQTYLLNGNIPHYNILTKFFMTYVQFFRYGYHIAFSFILLWIGIWTYKYRKSLPQQLVISLTFLLILLNVHILSFVGVAYYSPISGRMLIFVDSVIFIIFFKFFQFKLSGVNLQRYSKWFYSICLFILLYVSISYYHLHQFVLSREKLIAIRVNNDLILPNYTANVLLKYPVYFDDITANKNDFRNSGFAAYYGLHSVLSSNISTTQNIK